MILFGMLETGLGENRGLFCGKMWARKGYRRAQQKRAPADIAGALYVSAG